MARGRASSRCSMPHKETKTREELEALIMAELRQHPECKNVEGVAITRPLGRPWDIDVLRDGPRNQDGVPQKDLRDHHSDLQSVRLV
jgi:hypothetical protein